MEDQIKLVIYSSNGYFLEDNRTSTLCLLTAPVSKNEDFLDVALQFLNKVGVKLNSCLPPALLKLYVMHAIMIPHSNRDPGFGVLKGRLKTKAKCLG